MKTDGMSGAIVDAAIKVHRSLGPGLLESAYEACLAYELRTRGLRAETQAALPVEYEAPTWMSVIVSMCSSSGKSSRSGLAVGRVRSIS